MFGTGAHWAPVPVFEGQSLGQSLRPRSFQGGSSADLDKRVVIDLILRGLAAG